MDNKPALNLFESIEPNGTVELEGLGTVNLSHFPYREDLAYGWPDDAVRFHDQALPFDGRKLLYGHTHQLSAAGARPESLNTGWNVVVDAQHANPEYANELARLATRHGAIWRTEDFDVPLDELLRRKRGPAARRPCAGGVHPLVVEAVPPRDVPPAQSRRPERQPA